jgi:iron(III) transport system substrate-binding protein
MGEHDAGATQADFLASGSSALYQQRPELFIPLTSENIPNLPKDPVAKAANSDYTLFQIDPHLTTYNSDLVTADDLKNHLATWEGLADPFWAGKIALNDPRNSSNQMSFMIMLRDTYGADWFKRFNANKPELVDTASAGSQQVAAGAYQILVPTIPSQSAAVRAQGAPVGLYLPGGTAHAPAQGMAVPVNAKHPNAGLVFLNWKLSPEGQALTCKLGGVPVVHVDDPDCHATLPEKFVLGKDVIDQATQKEIFDLIGLRP